MTEILIYSGRRYEVCECRNCGAVFFVLESVRDEQRKNGGFSHCPNGHQWGWRKGDSENDRIRRERDLLRQQMAQKDDELAEAHRQAIAARTAEKQALRKLKTSDRRSAAGVCQCCNRSFKQLSAHMKNEHPKFIAEAVQ